MTSSSDVHRDLHFIVMCLVDGGGVNALARFAAPLHSNI
jgi:hypothetical protein